MKLLTPKQCRAYDYLDVVHTGLVLLIMQWSIHICFDGISVYNKKYHYNMCCFAWNNTMDWLNKDETIPGTIRLALFIIAFISMLGMACFIV